MPNRRRNAQRGQTLLIFALSAIVLFALVGLGVDAGVAYFNSSLEERAAAASSLAGVTYMPDGCVPAGSTCSPGGPVGSHVLSVGTKNGFVVGGTAGVTINAYEVTSTCGAVNSPNSCAPNQCGAALQPACARNRLLVVVCEDINTSFLRVLGFSSTHDCRQAVAEYLRPITLGQPGSQLGSDLSSLGSSGNYYFARTEGWDTDRGQGDAFTPNPTNGSYATPAANPDVHLLSGSRSTECTSAATPCVFPLGSNSVAQRGGYNYLIETPAGQTGDVVQVYNPIFGPDANSNASNCAGAQTGTGTYNLHECDGDFDNMTNPTDPKQYSAMTYTLFSVPDAFDHSQDQIISQMTVYPIDARGWASNSWKDVKNGFAAHTGGMPNLWHQWVPICGYSPTSAPAATETSTLVSSALIGSCSLGSATSTKLYRLRVDTLDYNGLDPQASGLSAHSHAHKGTSFAVTPNVGPPSSSNTCAAPPPPSTTAGCTLGAIDDLALFTPIQVPAGTSNSFSVPLVGIPPEYAGHDVFINLYDPGDVSCSGNGCNQITVLEPSGAVARLGNLGAKWRGPSEFVPTNGTDTQIDSGDCPPLASNDLAGDLAVVSTRCGPPNGVPYNTGTTNLFNGTWIILDIAVPSTYNPGTNPGGWYWSLQYTLQGAGASAGDTITATVGVNGSPVHLIG